MILNGQHSGRTGARIGPLIPLIWLLAAAPVLSQDLPTRLTTEEPRKSVERAEPVRHGFFKRHWMPRMSRHLADVSPIHSLETDSGRFAGSAMDERVTDSAESRARRATRKALRTYLQKETAIGSFFERARIGREGIGRPAKNESMDFGVSVSHGVPEFEMRHRSAAGTTRFSAAFDGSLQFDFRPAATTSAQFRAAYVIERSELVLSYRHGF